MPARGHAVKIVDGPVPEHPDDALSGWLDGELDPVERAAVAAHLQACATCPGELAALAATRSLVRGLAAPEPPPGFLEHAIARTAAEPDRRERRWGGVSLVATAAAWAVILGLAQSGPSGVIDPPLDAFVADHAQASALGPFGGLVAPGGGDAAGRGDGEGGSQPPGSDVSSSLGTLAVPLLPSRGVPGVFELPRSLGRGFELVGAEVGDGVLQAVYSDGSTFVSVFEQRGQVDWGDLDGGEWIDVGGERAWRAVVQDTEVVVLERGAIVYTLVGPAPGNVAATLSRDMPAPPPPGFWDRVREAGRGLLDAFAFGGG